MEQNKSTNDTKSHKGTVNTPMKKNLKNQTPRKARSGSSLVIYNFIFGIY
jgi:hypothetical protein